MVFSPDRGCSVGVRDGARRTGWRGHEAVDPGSPRLSGRRRGRLRADRRRSPALQGIAQRPKLWRRPTTSGWPQPSRTKRASGRRATQLQIAERQFDGTATRPDGMGAVTSLAAEVGQVVAQGQTIMKVASTNALDIVVSIPEQDLEEIQQWRSARSSLSGLNPTSPARKLPWPDLREVKPGADPATRTYRQVHHFKSAGPHSY